MSKVDKYKKYHLQLRSELDEPTSECDTTWAALVASSLCVDYSNTLMQISLPESKEAEACILDTVEHLATAISSECSGFYKTFGWTCADEYFRTQGSCQAMITDLEHNDLDDRLAILILAFQVASANLERKMSGDECSSSLLLLDGRTYEHAAALTVWRLLRLAFRLHTVLSSCGLKIRVVLSDRRAALESCANYLGVAAEPEALDRKVPGISVMFQEGTDMLRPSLQNVWAEGDVASLWVVGGLCAQQVDDIDALLATPGLKLSLFEQSQPAWHSMNVDPGAERQPAWELASDQPLPDAGYGAEPSNIRSSAEPYPQTLHTYMRFQHAIARANPTGLRYVVPTLARTSGSLPAPAGQQMLRCGGRLLQVYPGPEYTVFHATDKPRAERAFAGLLAASTTSCSETLYPELCQAARDDADNVRPGIEHVSRYGTNMPDAIVVALAARPPALLRARAMMRRLAAVSDEATPYMTWTATI